MSNHNRGADGSHSSGAASLFSTIRRLALIADDDQISVQTPTRVAEALHHHGYLLGDQEMATLQSWLGQG
jgi:hypothetical protein